MDYCLMHDLALSQLTDEFLIYCSELGLICDECSYCVSSNSVF